ncbi:MAG: PIN domain-containing protein [Isosphaeraceae bacterium]
MPERGTLADTGPLVAIVSTDDEHHEACVAALAAIPAPLLTCWPVLTEAAWLLRRRPDALAKLLESFDAGLLSLLPLDDAAVPWIAAFLKRYESLGAQLADAALVYLAEREGLRTVFTLDRRDFSIYRLKRNRALRLLPDL